jgi:sugar phosphate isomerase/epimerase
MKIGMFTANFLDRDLESVFRMMAEHGYEAAELPAFHGNGHLDIDEVLKPGEAKKIRVLAGKYNLTISALSNHPEGQLVLGPHTKDTDFLYPGRAGASAAGKIKFGMERMKQTARAAAALEVPVVCGFIGCEKFSRWFPWPYPQGWDEMAEDFVNRWGEILDVFAQEGVRFAHEPHPNEYVYNVETAVRSVELMGGRKEWGFNFDPANIILQGIDPVIFVQELGERIFHAHAKDGEIVEHNVRRSGLQPTGKWDRIDRGFRFRIPGWGSVPWKRVLTEFVLKGYDYVLSYEHEDVVMSREDGLEKTIGYLRPLIIKGKYTGRGDKLFE